MSYKFSFFSYKTGQLTGNGNWPATFPPFFLNILTVPLFSNNTVFQHRSIDSRCYPPRCPINSIDNWFTIVDEQLVAASLS